MIDVEHLTKRYGAVTAVDDVSFSVPKGQVVGFLGPNGAGKTTTMKILTGYLAPEVGRAQVDGFDSTDESLECRRRIGYLPEGNPLYPDLKVREALRFAAEMRGLRGASREKAVDGTLERVAMADKAHRITSTLSRGERQRVGLAQALLHEPPVLVLDEPTSGLDPNQQREMRGLIRSLGGDRTIILSTHILPEVEAVCDRAVIISRGRLVADGTVASIRRRGRVSTVVEVRGSVEATRAALGSLTGLPAIAVESLADAPGYVRATVEGDASRTLGEEIARRVATAGLALCALRPETAGLDAIFAQLTSDEPSSGAGASDDLDAAADEVSRG